MFYCEKIASGGPYSRHFYVVDWFYVTFDYVRVREIKSHNLLLKVFLIWKYEKGVYEYFDLVIYERIFYVCVKK
jgi:hypothetical protein